MNAQEYLKHWEQGELQQAKEAVASSDGLHAKSKNAKSKNGDTLADLEARATNCSARIKRYSDKITEGDAALAPYRELLHEAEAEMSNLMCRINVWLREHGK